MGYAEPENARRNMEEQRLKDGYFFSKAGNELFCGYSAVEMRDCELCLLIKKCDCCAFKVPCLNADRAKHASVCFNY